MVFAKRGTGLKRYTRGKQDGGFYESGQIVKFIATGAGAGLTPLMPGTAGTLVGIPVYLVLTLLSPPLQLLTMLALTAGGCYIAQEAEKIYRQKDPPRIVIDEIVGLQWTLIFIPPTAVGIFLGFLFFRFFDIVKPPPIKWLERKLPGGWGVMADDLAAAVSARISLEGATYLIGLW